MKVNLKVQPVYDAVEWHPEMDGSHPKWGPAAFGMHQASHDMGVVGILTLAGKQVTVHDGDFIVSDQGGIVEVLPPDAFYAKYDAQRPAAPVAAKPAPAPPAPAPEVKR